MKRFFLITIIFHLMLVGTSAQRIMTLQECVKEARANNVSAVQSTIPW